MAVIQIVIPENDEALAHVEAGAGQLSLSKSGFALIALKRGLSELARLGFVHLDTNKGDRAASAVSNIIESEAI